MDRTQACGACNRGSIPLEGVPITISPVLAGDIVMCALDEKESRSIRK